MWKRRRRPGDFDAEIESHLAHEIDRLQAQGLSPEAARTAASRAFGNMTAARERFFEAHPLRWLDHAVQDLRVAWRNLARYPVACTVAVLSLGAGIGSTTATLLVRDAVFYNPPPLYKNPSELWHVRLTAPDQPQGLVPAAVYRDWTANGTPAVHVAAALPSRAREMRRATQIESVQVQETTPGLFSLLGVSPALGRAFDADLSGAESTAVVLGHGVWQRHFQGRPDVIGETIRLDGIARVVTGVMPPRFWFDTMMPTIWVPLDVSRLPADQGVLVAMRHAGTPASIDAALQPHVVAYAASLPQGDRRLRVSTSTMSRTPLGHQVGYLVVVLLGVAVLLTLLIACTNVSVLVIAQWTAREHEIAIRTALGASRSRVVRTLLTESVLIAVLGGLLGVSATFALRGLLVSRLPGAALFDLSIDAGLLWRVVAVTLGVGVLSGLAPALYETRRLHTSPLRAAAASDRVRQRWRSALVVFEITVTMALLVVTGALLSSYRRALTPDTGVVTSGLLTARIEAGPGVTSDSVRDLLAAQPGVSSVALATPTPILGRGPEEIVAVDRARAGALEAERVVAGPGLFSTLGVAMRAGRDFAEADQPSAPGVVIVNDVLAERLWPGQSSVGRELWIAERAHEVVGVVASYRSFLRPSRPTFYLPLAQSALDVSRVTFLVRTSGQASALAPSVRAALLTLGSGTRPNVHTIDQILAVASQEILATTFPLVPLLVTGMMLTAAGIYGVLAFAVTRRARELAIRVAVGASRRDVLRLVASQAVRLLAFGSLFGVGSTFALTRVAQGSGTVFDSPGWVAFAGPVLLIALVGLVATWVPVRRALNVDPAKLLRTI